jgi:hypothetical protein
MSEHETEIRDCLERGLHIDPYNVRGILRELDELRKDKARLDWLDSCGDVCSDLTGKYNWKEWLVSTINSSMKLDASIRSAIDSEMKLTKEENEN